MSSSNRFTYNGVYTDKVPFSSDDSTKGTEQTRRLTSNSYPHHPFIKMPGQDTQGGFDASSRVAQDTSSRDKNPSHSHRSSQPNLKVPKKTQSQSATRPEASKPNMRPLNQARWEEIADKTDNLLLDSTNHIIDCFINAQQAIKELEEAIRSTAHRKDLSAGMEATTEGLDTLNCDLFQVITNSFDELRERQFSF
ncbi:hypothetical protein MGN70_006821 [Eutypa lata]|nr:hypothetical protein MGN70_006821 [Eutypa lata]